MKSQIPQRMDKEDVIIRAKIIMMARKLKIGKDDAQRARCFKISNENMWSIINYIKDNEWLLNK